ncbi:MAG TPA: helix-turn-helix domain-containing protein [Myxococcota bacterium]|nr:helix-turn-helix domain-containing protein [Myxococcota bacterium]
MQEQRARQESARPVRTLPSGGAHLADAASEAFAGGAPLVRRLREQLASAAALRGPVLITGEPGSGRTRAARWLHVQSAPRAQFLALRGLPPRANVGEATLFLPDLDEAPVAVQAEWRAWLAAAPACVRAIATARVAWPSDGSFELFAELRRFVIQVPALRERRDDFAAIAVDIAREIAGELAAPPLTFGAGALAALERAPWIASAAVLRRVLEQLAAGARCGEPVSASEASGAAEAQRPNVATLREQALVRERDQLLAALAAAGGNMARTARRLGRSRAAVYRLLAKHGIALGTRR